MAGGQEFAGELPDWMLTHDGWPPVNSQTIEEVTCECCPNRTTARDGFCNECRRFEQADDQARRDLHG